jgi:hypothetical protein
VSAPRGCLDGPSLVTHLRHAAVDLGRLSETDQRAVQRWSRGHQGRIDTADRILMELGLHLSLAPDECFCRYRNGRLGCRQRVAA